MLSFSNLQLALISSVFTLIFQPMNLQNTRTVDKRKYAKQLHSIYSSFLNLALKEMNFILLFQPMHLQNTRITDGNMLSSCVQQFTQVFLALKWIKFIWISLFFFLRYAGSLQLRRYYSFCQEIRFCRRNLITHSKNVDT